MTCMRVKLIIYIFKILFGKFDGGLFIYYQFARARLEKNITISIMGIYINSLNINFYIFVFFF